MNKDLFLGIDMGGTDIKIAIVDSDIKIVDMTSIHTDTSLKPEMLLKNIVGAASKLKGYEEVKNIGLGTTGDINFREGILRYGYNLHWKNVHIKNILQKYTKKKVSVDNDANTAALGAFWLDTKGKVDNLICVTLGTGVGGGIIINKKLYRGSSFSAGEVGHQTIKFDGLSCSCGNVGCAEAYLGAKNFTHYCIAYIKEHKSKIISKLIDNDFSKFNPEILYKAALKNDKIALKLWNYNGQLLGILLANIITFMNPSAMVLCGGLSQAKKFIIKPAKDEMRKRGWATSVKICQLIFSKHTSKLGVVGAAMLAKQ
jgi:glucokinase